MDQTSLPREAKSPRIRLLPRSPLIEKSRYPNMMTSTPSRSNNYFSGPAAIYANSSKSPYQRKNLNKSLECVQVKEAEKSILETSVHEVSELVVLLMKSNNNQKTKKCSFNFCGKSQQSNQQQGDLAQSIVGQDNDFSVQCQIKDTVDLGFNADVCTPEE
ncbi:uncharacterized protein [Prorops nasuta]|uniref:uncharacterized protein n=1 Tax=Prorops nasuta TaxID=863751 RepID=UPI0034CD4610